MPYETEHIPPYRHYSPRILGTKCDGCRCMTVLAHERYRTKVVEYWCEHFHAKVDPFNVECDYAPEKIELRKPNRRPLP